MSWHEEKEFTVSAYHHVPILTRFITKKKKGFAKNFSHIAYLTDLKKEKDLPSLNECSQHNIFDKVDEFSSDEKSLKSMLKTSPENFKENSNEIITVTDKEILDQSKCISEKKPNFVLEKEKNYTIEKVDSETINSESSLLTTPECKIKVLTNFFETDDENNSSETLPENSMKNLINQSVINSNNVACREKNFGIKKKNTEYLNVHNDQLITDDKSKTSEQILEKIDSKNTDCSEIIRGTHSLVNEEIVPPSKATERNCNNLNVFKSVCQSQLEFSTEEIKRNKITSDKNNSVSNSETKIFHSSQSIFDVPMYQDKNELNSNLTGIENCDIIFKSSERKGEDLSELNMNHKNFDNKTNPSENQNFELVSTRISEDLTIVDVDDREEDLSKIFIEMKRIRLLSPIKDIEKEKKIVSLSNSTCDSLMDKNISVSKLHESRVDFNNDEQFNDPLLKLEKKRHLIGLNSNKIKKVKTNETGGNSCQSGFLDSIICAMSIQNQEFKSNSFKKEQNVNLTNNTREQIPLNNNTESESNLRTYDCVSLGGHNNKKKGESESRNFHGNSFINTEEKKENGKILLLSLIFFSDSFTFFLNFNILPIHAFFSVFPSVTKGKKKKKENYKFRA